jgi:Abnormal spindle-like microcephaly-assoc'd, ASPM-SPD-2-Hydin
MLGGTTSAGYPEVNSLQSCNASPNYLQGYVSEIDASGALTFSTCLGNNGSIVDLVLDSAQNVDLVGYSDATLMLKNPIQSNLSGFGGAFIAAINPNSHSPSLLFSSFMGSGKEGESFGGVGVDSGGKIYAAGTVFDYSVPPSFPVFNALQPTVPLNPGYTAAGFVMKISPTDAAAAALAPGAVIFDPQQVGTPSNSQTVTVFDMGSAALMVSNVTVTGDFSVQNNCGTVSPAGGTCTIQVTFTPTATGTRTGILTITDSSAGSPRTVGLTGQGAVVTLTIAPQSISFGNQAVGTTSTAQAVTVTNPGPVLPSGITRVQTSGDFSESNNCGTSLPVNTSCTVNVTFTPTASGSRTGSLTLTDGATDSPQTITLSP